VRYRFGPSFEQAIRVRGLDLVRIAEMANVAPSTVSSAIRGKRLNVATAVRIAKAVAKCDIVPELESWVADELMDERA
jgi:predicted transcriptional regulator